MTNRNINKITQNTIEIEKKLLILKLLDCICNKNTQVLIKHHKPFNNKKKST